MTTDGHILRYCVPMDNQRPQLDLRFFKDICPDRNVPVIVVFTKHDQFRRNARIYVEDFGSSDDKVIDVMKKRFQEHYLRPLGEDVKYVRLEKMHMKKMRCDILIAATAALLKDNIVGLMFLAVQRGNLRLSVEIALKRVRHRTGSNDTVRECLIPFPYIWFAAVVRCVSSVLTTRVLGSPVFCEWLPWLAAFQAY
ncbi:hypothetical protein EDB85DRAFT_1165859 [Lactarius pseudohatsudake]|nr:hypothetical protein EDB85DRAFT_1165859 [Lactarius pseudohatsudake]